MSNWRPTVEDDSGAAEEPAAEEAAPESED